MDYIINEIRKSQEEMQQTEFIAVRNFFIRFNFTNNLSIPSNLVVSFEELEDNQFRVVVREPVGLGEMPQKLKEMVNKWYHFRKHDVFKVEKIVIDKTLVPLYSMIYDKCYVKSVKATPNCYNSDDLMSYSIICGYKDIKHKQYLLV